MKTLSNENKWKVGKVGLQIFFHFYRMKQVSYFLILFIIGFSSCNSSPEIKRQQLLLKGNIALNDNNLKQAIYYYDQCIEMSDTLPDPFNNRAIAYERLGDFQNAFSDYDKAILVDPDFFEAYINRAKLFVETRNFRSALLDLEKLDDVYRDSSSFHFVKGLANTGLRSFDKALENFEKAKKLSPENPEIDINLATVLYYKKDFDSAAEAIDRMVNGQQIPEAFNLKALLLIESNQLELAEEQINQALQLSSNSFFYNNRGYIRLLHGKLDEGLKDINQSLLMNDENAWAYRNKGYYFYLKGEYGEAIELLIKSIELDPNVLKSREFLGLAYVKNEETNLACQIWQQAVASGENECAVFLDEYCTN